MELKDFIKTAIKDITEAVRDVEDELSQDVLIRVHTNMEYNGFPSVSYKSVTHEKQAPMTVVGFRVRVRAEDKTSTDGKVSANVLNVIGGGINGESTQSSETTQELSFSIPIVWKERGG